jgi:phosphoenolpyruvate carboxylase
LATKDEYGLDDGKLRQDIKMLGQMLGIKIRNENKSVYDAVEKLRELGRQVNFNCIKSIAHP